MGMNDPLPEEALMVRAFRTPLTPPCSARQGCSTRRDGGRLFGRFCRQVGSPPDRSTASLAALR
jgi:hypothetical protein